jgi:hypothetical protein
MEEQDKQEIKPPVQPFPACSNFYILVLFGVAVIVSIAFNLCPGLNPAISQSFSSVVEELQKHSNK